MSQPPDLPTPPGEPNLRRALASLPAHEPDPTTWPRIAAQLAADADLARATQALPAHEPDENLWLRVAAGLATPALAAAAPRKLAAPAAARRLWPARAGRRVLALAASLLLVLGGWWQLRPATSGPGAAQETLTISEEAAAPALPALPTDPLERQGLVFIEAHCAAQPGVCQSGEFRTLRTQLQELEAQQTQLRQAARRFGTSPELLREQARLITLKASVTRELVHLLIS